MGTKKAVRVDHQINHMTTVLTENSPEYMLPNDDREVDRLGAHTRFMYRG